MTPPAPDPQSLGPRSLGPRLDEIDAVLARDPDQVELRYLRAGMLASVGWFEAARDDYLAVIVLAPTHFGALNDLGTLLYNADFRSAARLAYAEAVRHHPDNPIGRINLGNALSANGEVESARAEYDAALRLAPDHPDAHQGMANLLQDLGEAEAAENHRRRSYHAREITTVPYRGAGTGCRVLLLVSAAGGNVPTRFLLDDTVFAVWVLAVEAHTDRTILPPHDLVFNAVGDADLCASALDAAEAVLARTAAPVINSPRRVRATGRADNAERLAGLPGVATPRVALAPRGEVAAAAKRFGFPLLLRSPGFHTGRHFQRVETPDDLPAVVGALPGRELMLIEPLAAQGADGWWRKYRVMIVAGRLYPMHLAISANWKVHYFTADMAERPEYRALEAAFLDDMPGVLGARAMAGLDRIAQSLDLDYAGVDFGLGPGGEVLVFEANATMVVNPPDSDPRWDYRRAPVNRILAATKAMMLERAAR